MVTYCFEDDSRGQDILKHILGDSQVKALQSDGYNVYKY
ncbi:transposase domain protein [Bacteroides fragilis str. J-143-4]|nr:transposase domain protein [Bacteroides fragilis str. J-143-4]